MATPDTWDLAQTDAPPPPPPSAAPAAAADPTSDYIRQQLALLQAPLPSVQPDTTPVKRGWLSLLGEAIGGGPQTDAMSPAQRERAGLRALGDFGTSLMAGSGYYPGKPMFGGLAQGFEGASRSEAGSEQQAASYLGAQQNWQMERQKLQMERLKEALPLLQMQAGANIPNPLLANAPVVPGTAGGAGKPGGGGIALGMRQNNPLNLTFAGQPGAQPGPGNRFATFSDLPSGVAATADQLALYQTQHGINTVQDAVKRWVSDPKADLTSYTADVANALGVKPTDKIDLTDPTVQQKFILAAQPHESGGGGAVLNPADVAKGVQLAAANRGQTVQAPPAPYQVAGKTVAPPSGSTTAPAATPPPPGQTPPAAPTTTADATPPAPAGQLTLEQFQAQHPIAINAADYTVTPPGLAEARAAQAAAAQQLSLARAGRGGDPNKSLSDYNTATQAVNKLQQDAQAKSLELQQAAQKNALDTQRQLYEAEMTRRQGDEKAAADRAHAIELAKLNADLTRQTNKDTVVNTTNQKGLETAQQEQHDTGNIVAQLDGFRALSDNVEQPKLWQNVSLPGMKATIAETLGSLGLPLSDTGAVQLLRSGINGLVSTLRQGMPMGSLSDTDLKFIERLGPTEWMDKDTRSAVVGYLKQAYQAKNRFSFDVQKEMSRGKSYGDALDAANQNRKPFVPAVPAELSAHWTDPDPNWAQQRLKWAQDNDIRPGTLYHLNNGAVMVAKSPPQQGQR
jgi:hypothetical protein